LEEAGVCYCLRRRQELALLLDILAVSYPGGVGFLVLNTFDHLVQVEAD